LCNVCARRQGRCYGGAKGALAPQSGLESPVVGNLGPFGRFVEDKQIEK